MGLWDSVKGTANKAGNATMVAAQQTKLKAERQLLDREMNARKQKFGEVLYDHVSPMTASTEFYGANDKLTNTLRPPLITAQKEIAALSNKRTKRKEQINMAAVERQGAFPTPATTFSQKVKNAGKSASMAGNEAKLKTELGMVERQIKTIKQEFGVEMYQLFHDLEDTEGWVPTERQVRSMYDQSRSDIEALQKKKNEKKEEIKGLGKARPVSSTPDTLSSHPVGNTFVERPVVHVQAQPIGGYSSQPGVAATAGGSSLMTETPFATAQAVNGFPNGNNSGHYSGNFSTQPPPPVQSPVVDMFSYPVNQTYATNGTSSNNIANAQTNVPTQHTTPDWIQNQNSQTQPTTPNPFQNNNDLLSWEY